MIYKTINKNDPIFRKALLETHNYQCFYTGEPLTYEMLEVDHILPSHLASKKQYSTIRQQFPDFNINSIANFVPTSKEYNGSIKRGHFDDYFTARMIKNNIEKYAYMTSLLYEHKIKTLSSQKNNASKIISFYSPKGGVGCTTIGLLLAKTLNFSFITGSDNLFGKAIFNYEQIYSYGQPKASIWQITPHSVYDLQRYETNANIMTLLKFSSVFFVPLQPNTNDIIVVATKLKALLAEPAIVRYQEKIYFIITGWTSKGDADHTANLLSEYLDHPPSNFLYIRKRREFDDTICNDGIGAIRNSDLRNSLYQILEKADIQTVR